MSIAQCFQNLHLASIHMTISVGFSYHWVALQPYMKGHKVNENSIKTLLAFSEITKPYSELNISFSVVFFFFNSLYPEPEKAETVLSLSPFFRWGCYFRRNWRLWFWRGLFEGVGIFYVQFWEFFFSFLLLKKDPLIGVYISFCMFWLEFLDKLIPEGERSHGNVTLYPTSFEMYTRIFLQTQTLFAVAFLGEKLDENTMW